MPGSRRSIVPGSPAGPETHRPRAGKEGNHADRADRADRTADHDGGRGRGRRIAGERGAHFVDLAGATIRNISRGVIGVALLQALIAGLVLTLLGVPGAGLAAFLVLMFCIVQVGPIPVLLPIIIWAWATRDTGPALLLTVLLIPIPVIDNVLKPILMARGLSTPMLVILLGVIGGTVVYGLIGLFFGPILLGIFYELLMAWMRNDPPGAEPEVIA